MSISSLQAARFSPGVAMARILETSYARLEHFQAELVVHKPDDVLVSAPESGRDDSIPEAVEEIRKCVRQGGRAALQRRVRGLKSITA
jgi:hypothetical protein